MEHVAAPRNPALRAQGSRGLASGQKKIDNSWGKKQQVSIMTDQIHSRRNIANYSFRFICHNCGSGPFCRFRIPSNLPLEGVYALLIGESVRYVGECIHLSKRFNMGYGQISPRNCFVGGQPQIARLTGTSWKRPSAGSSLDSGSWRLRIAKQSRGS